MERKCSKGYVEYATAFYPTFEMLKSLWQKRNEKKKSSDDWRYRERERKREKNKKLWEWSRTIQNAHRMNYSYIYNIYRARTYIYVIAMLMFSHIRIYSRLLCVFYMLCTRKYQEEMQNKNKWNEKEDENASDTASDDRFLLFLFSWTDC